MKLRPYFQLMRLHQPTGIWLLFWPCAWGAALASEGLPSPYLLALFFLGAVLMRGAGCVINDWWDRKFDREVERTKHRPLASGALGTRQAIGLLILLLLPAFAVMWALPTAARVLAILSLPLIVLYPLMKRVTWWPQAFLGLTFNWGALMGWAAVRGDMEAPALLLYAAGFFWTLAYDTVYACQDMQDDARIGVKSTARRLGPHLRPTLAAFYAAMLLLLAASGWLVALHPVFFACLILIGGFFFHQLLTLQPGNPAHCLRQFKAHALIGGWVFAAILLGQFY